MPSPPGGIACIDANFCSEGQASPVPRTFPTFCFEIIQYCQSKALASPLPPIPNPICAYDRMKYRYEIHARIRPESIYGHMRVACTAKGAETSLQFTSHIYLC